jgi:hypothetical protein
LISHLLPPPLLHAQNHTQPMDKPCRHPLSTMNSLPHLFLRSSFLIHTSALNLTSWRVRIVNKR